MRFQHITYHFFPSFLVCLCVKRTLSSEAELLFVPPKKWFSFSSNDFSFQRFSVKWLICFFQNIWRKKELAKEPFFGMIHYKYCHVRFALAAVFFSAFSFSFTMREFPFEKGINDEKNQRNCCQNQNCNSFNIIFISEKRMCNWMFCILLQGRFLALACSESHSLYSWPVVRIETKKGIRNSRFLFIKWDNIIKQLFV